jgi:hypothetical protein
MSSAAAEDTSESTRRVLSAVHSHQSAEEDGPTTVGNFSHGAGNNNNSGGGSSSSSSSSSATMLPLAKSPSRVANTDGLPVITIQETTPAAFRALLYFLYTEHFALMGKTGSLEEIMHVMQVYLFDVPSLTPLSVVRWV